jgi:hypothetical protein
MKHLFTSLIIVSTSLTACHLELPEETQEYQLKYLGDYDSEGKPEYLLAQPDTVSQALLEVIEASLPAGQPVPVHHPEFLKENLITNVNLIGDADLWVTFVDEGASYRNAVGYYTYDMASPPTRLEDVTSFNIIFPNLSMIGSGGELTVGDKVFLGHFTAGTSVGWFLVPDGWNKTAERVDMKPGVKFSDKILNTFTDAQNCQHMTLLYDQAFQKLILGIEDMSRPNGDQDFNDALFYVTANPFEAIQPEWLATPRL